VITVACLLRYFTVHFHHWLIWMCIGLIVCCDVGGSLLRVWDHTSATEVRFVGIGTIPQQRPLLLGMEFVFSWFVLCLISVLLGMGINRWLLKIQIMKFFVSYASLAVWKGHMFNLCTLYFVNFTRSINWTDRKQPPLF
jgi:hypothetical protein